MLFDILYLIGLTAVGITGAIAAGREKMDIFGVIVIAEITAFGGGSVRDVLLGHYPLAWVENPNHFLLIAGAALVTIFGAPLIKHFNRHFHIIFLVLDGLGLIAFAILGTQVALTMGHGFTIAAVAAMITGAFGGVLRDLLCNRIPLVFQGELYASVAFLSTCIYIGLQYLQIEQNIVVFSTLIIGFIIRLLAIYYGWGLPVFDFQDHDSPPHNDDKLPDRQKYEKP